MESSLGLRAAPLTLSVQPSQSSAKRALEKADAETKDVVCHARGASSTTDFGVESPLNESAEVRFITSPLVWHHRMRMEGNALGDLDFYGYL